MTRSSRCAAAVAAAALLALPLLADTHPNSRKYRDSGIPNGQGSSGSATVETRALFNKDLSTDVEITTGSFDSSDPAPGTISKVQLKAAGRTTNYNDLDAGGTFAAHVDAIALYDVVEIQTHVRGISNGTDVVQLNETVKRRPDLAVTAVSNIAESWTNNPINIWATIRELNGDTGARANCRLLANGAEIDRAEGIWVDANDSVECRFVDAFESAGTYALQVVVDAVNPGDWDASNNSASGQIRIYEDQSFYSWDATATEENRAEHTYSRTTVSEARNDGGGVTQMFDVNADIDHQIDLAHITLSIKVTSDGATLAEAGTPEVWTPAGNIARTCIDGHGGGVHATLCKDKPGRFFRNDHTSVQLHTGAAHTVYHSSGYHQLLPPQNPGDPYYTYDEIRTDDSLRAPFGSSVNMDVQVSDGNALWHAEPRIASFATSTTHSETPYHCGYSFFYGGYICDEGLIDVTTRRGFDASYLHQ